MIQFSSCGNKIHSSELFLTKKFLIHFLNIILHCLPRVNYFWHVESKIATTWLLPGIEKSNSK